MAYPKHDYPEPPPVKAGQVIPDILIAWLEVAREQIGSNATDEAIELVKSRDAYGRAKYKQPLMTGDGRDIEHDALQEGGDILQYVMSAKIQGAPLERVKRIIRVVNILLEA